MLKRTAPVGETNFPDLFVVPEFPAPKKQEVPHYQFHYVGKDGKIYETEEEMNLADEAYEKQRTEK